MIIVRKSILSYSLLAFLFTAFITWSCTKLDTTDIGSDLLPAVDNVHTFDTTLTINTSQGIFNDTTVISNIDDHVMGRISNDPLFGQTTANIFFQPKPSFYPYYIGGVPTDTLVGFDSVVLCIKYKGFYGDSVSPVQLNVQQIFNNGFRDSANKARDVNYSITTAGSLGPVLGTTTVDVRRILQDTVRYRNRRDYSVGVIRIKMDQAWAAALYGRDSILGSASNNAFYNDSLFRRFYNGIAIMAGTSGNTLLYTNLADTNTKLEIHYRKRTSNIIDTIFTSLKINAGTLSTTFSATANQVIRNRAGYPVSTPNTSEIFLQTAPGTYANLSIPGLGGLDNRLVHRAEIIVEQIPNGPLDNVFMAPSTLYLDLKDTGSVDKWKPVYFDLNPSVFYDPDNPAAYWPGEIDFTYFGPFRREKTDLFGNLIKYYNFNVTRYVQQVVTKRTPNYMIRLFAAYRFRYPQLGSGYLPGGGLNSIAFGRVRVGSGSNANYKMRMRIIYSKL